MKRLDYRDTAIMYFEILNKPKNKIKLHCADAAFISKPYLKPDMNFRKAKRRDVLTIMQMIADDPLGKTREELSNPLPDYYYQAFDTISKQDNQELIVVEDEAGNIIGTLQLSFLQYLNRKAGLRLLVESVRVKSDQRGKGIGKKIFEWVIKRGKERKALIIQLTTDRKRPEALRFYESLGFVNSHHGMKLHL